MGPARAEGVPGVEHTQLPWVARGPAISLPVRAERSVRGPHIRRDAKLHTEGVAAEENTQLHWVARWPAISPPIRAAGSGGGRKIPRDSATT